jgi:hypothetical protein
VTFVGLCRCRSEVSNKNGQLIFFRVHRR